MFQMNKALPLIWAKFQQPSNSLKIIRACTYSLAADSTCPTRDTCRGATVPIILAITCRVIENRLPDFTKKEDVQVICSPFFSVDRNPWALSLASSGVAKLPRLWNLPFR